MFRDESGVVLAASDITDSLACAHLIQQTLTIARGERARPRPVDDPYAELVQTRGLAHEAEQLELLGDRLGGYVDLSAAGVPRTREQLAAAASRTEEAMREGPPLIFQATFFDGRWQGRADFLQRVDSHSALGAWSYEVVDTKLARRVKPATVHQLMLYSALLAQIQDAEPALAHVILGDGTREPVELSRYAALHRHVRRSLSSLVEAPARETYPEPVEHCAVCSFARECHARLRDDDHLSLVARAGRVRRERLVDLGIGTVAELAAADPGTDPQRLGAEAFDLLRHQAALQVASRESGEPRRRHLTPERAAGYALLPSPSPGDVSFDLEGDPFIGDEGIEYLWGWTGPGGVYEHEWAHDPAGEKRALERFVDTVLQLRREHPGMHVYHYAAHERSKLRSLAMKYASREDEVDDLLRSGTLVDLFAVVRHALQIGEESYSLKSLERHHGFERLETSVREGGGSIVMYERWLELGADEMLESIRAYNEEDCRSTESLREWLVGEMTPEAEVEFGVSFADLAEPEPEEPRQPPAWLADLTSLADRLLDGLDPDASHDTPEEARRRLTSHMLLYHHREAKPEWWRYFELDTLSLDDLLWERDAISGLQRDDAVPPAEFKQSLDYVFRFPEQEHKLSLGEVRDPIDGNTYNLVELGERHLVLRRRKSADPPAPRALAGCGPVRVDRLRDALVEVGGAVADGALSGATLDLLDRVPPDLPAALLTESVEGLIDAAYELGAGVLPVQGPPGTGKTYRAARMIVGALASGLRVGLTAQSHAAIHNLLREVEEAALEWPFRFDGVYKGGGYTSPGGFVKTVADNKRVTDEYQLAAGTAWLFARPEHRGAFDLLFVDEAGQYSLANTVAASTSARGLVLLGDPQQLPQVNQTQHPFGAGASALEHLLDGASTIPEGRGVLLTESWRMHPGVCDWVSRRSYEGKLRSKAECADRRIESSGALSGAGLRRIEIEHSGRSQYSPEEAAMIGAATRELMRDGVVIDSDGSERPLGPGDILVVAPYNMAVNEISRAVPAGVEVGTVDRFQGREAPVTFYALTCSAGEEVPRGVDFLFNPNRMNVAVSRAQCLAVLVYSPRLLEANCPSLESMELLNGICDFVENAHVVEQPFQD